MESLMHETAHRLPVWQQAKEIQQVAATLPSGGFLILRAEPGSGKTSIVPTLLSEQFEGIILVSEPRRLAAIGAAQFAAKLIGQGVGEKIGYAVRGDKKWGPATRVLYVTEGVALNLLSDPSFIKTLSCLVIDEFHERHAATDALILLSRMWSKLLIDKQINQSMRIVLMSATFDANKYAAMFEPMARIDVSGKVYPLTLCYEPLEDSLESGQNAGNAQFAPWRLPSYWNAVAAVTLREAREIQTNNPGHHVLCFLPGKGEIGRVRSDIHIQLEQPERRNCTTGGNLSKIAIEELHGDRPITQLLEAIYRDTEQSESAPTIIFLATNIAESSVTIPGVRTVVDTGLMRIAKHHLSSGTQELSMTKIGQNSAGQRAGRAAREGPGKAIRLYSESDFFKRPNETAPEICVSDLSRDLLDLARVAKCFATLVYSPESPESKQALIPATPEDWTALPWIDVPPAERIYAAITILRGTGCFDPSGNVTENGFRMGSLPLPVRLGAVLLHSSENIHSQAKLSLGIVAAACALVSEGDVVDASAGIHSDEHNELMTQYLALRDFILGKKQAHDFHRRLARVAQSLRASLSSFGISPSDSQALSTNFPAHCDLNSLGKIFFAGYFDLESRV
jgi:ATP-dependent helicase HrpB